MSAEEIRKKFLEFFVKRGHVIVPSSSLIPDDPSVLLTTAGMQQFKKYYTGEADPMKDFGTKNTCSIQKSFRTSDIDAVGDESHLTFFEMLGNFSFGGYWKTEAIQFGSDFFKTMGLPITYVTVFGGEDGIAGDTESEDVWRSLGITDIRKMGKADNFWGPTGSEGPCGPTTEIYANETEIWNIVFNEYYCAADGTYRPLDIRGIDTGMGLERLAMILQKKTNIFETDLFHPLIALLPETMDIRIRRIIADHLRGAVFLIADGVRPSNKEAGYILRRLLRRTLAYTHIAKLPAHILDALTHDAIHEYGGRYPEILAAGDAIRKEISNERDRFSKTLARGLRELGRAAAIDAAAAFMLYESYGLPFEIIKEVGGKAAAGLTRNAFDEEFKKHQEISRAGLSKKFGGHGLILDTGELKAGNEEELQQVTRLHTATHLLNAALRKVLGGAIEQRGSDITAERTRFDFTFPRKLTEDEIKKIESLVNYAIKKDFPVTATEMELADAKKSGALFFFKGKYPPRVKVYTVGDAREIFSRELCGGPHVTHTGDIGAFRIAKEEASSAGVRRIRGVID